MGDGAQALIFDVRNNLGGTVKSVTKILDKLLPSG
jgi:carboxyl-terminal processing protease